MEQGRAPPTQTIRTMVQAKPNPGKPLRNRTSTELEYIHNSTPYTMNDKICRYILQLRRYGSERSHSRTNQRSRNERIGAGRGFGPRLSLNSGCSLFFFFLSFLFLCSAFICMYWYLKSTRRVLRIWRSGMYCNVYGT